jgi:hypothetical protein
MTLRKIDRCRLARRTGRERLVGMRDARRQEIAEAVANGRATILRDHHERAFAAEAAVGGSVELRDCGTHKELAFDTHGGVTRVVCAGRTWQEVLLRIGVLVVEYETFVLVRGRGRPQLVQELGETAGNYWVHFGSHQAPLLPPVAGHSIPLAEAVPCDGRGNPLSVATGSGGLAVKSAPASQGPTADA